MDELSLSATPLGKGLFAGVVDTIGGHTLGPLLAHTRLFGNIASIGHAQSPEFNGTVLPHILRGVNLLGISSANTPIELRRKVWSLLQGEWRLRSLEKMPMEEISFDQLESTFKNILDRNTKGRSIVRIKSQ
jgi:NADPH2:quinone reductase